MSQPIIQGLNQYTAVRFGDVFIAKLGSSKYQIDGVAYTPQYQTNFQVVVPSLDNIYRVQKGLREISHYLSSENGFITVEEFKAAQGEISQYVTEDDEYDFPDIDTEFEVRKRLEPILRSQAVYKDAEESLVKVEIQVIGTQEDTGSDFIATPYVFGKTSFVGGGIYQVHVSRIAVSEFHKFVKDNDLKYEIPSHSHLEYAKIEKTYAFTGYKPAWVSRGNILNYFGNLEQAKEREAEVRKQVRKHLQMRFTDLNMEDLKVAEFYEKLQKIASKVAALDVKQRNLREHQSVLNDLKGVREQLEKCVEEASK